MSVDAKTVPAQCLRGRERAVEPTTLWSIGSTAHLTAPEGQLPEVIDSRLAQPPPCCEAVYNPNIVRPMKLVYVLTKACQ